MVRIVRHVLFFLTWLCLTALHASDIGIITTSMNGKPAYLIQVGAYTRQKDAEQMQKDLSTSVAQTIKIDHLADKGLYLVQIGPIQDYAVAVAIKRQLTLVPPHIPLQQPLPTYVVNNKQTINRVPPASKVWNLRNADIRAVISEVSRVTGKNFLIDPRVQGKISIISSTPMTDNELYQVFLSMLQVSGYAAIPSGDIVKIVPNIDARTISSDSLNHPSHGDDMMVQVIPVHYVSAEQLVPVLRPLMPQWSSVTAYGPSNMLILSGRASNIHQLAEIIRQVDSSTANGIDMIPLEHALAMDVVNTLKDLVKAQPGLGSRSQTMLAADDRSNSILLSGTKTDRIRLRLLIAQLDHHNTGATSSNTKVIYLNYLRAEDLVPILAGIAQASFSGNVGTTIGTVTRPALDSTNPAANMASMVNGTPTAPQPTPQPTANTNPQAMPNTTGTNNQNEGSTKPSVQIIAEPNTNSIIINAPPTLIRTLTSVVSQLDIKPAQLLIEALVAEINETDFKDLGIEWGTVDQKTLDNATFQPGFAIINSKTNINQFQARIYALARDHKANILSTPSVVVLDNRQAKIMIGKQVSVQTSSYPNNGNGTTTASPYTTFDRVNVALHLYVRPQITRGNGIQLQIDQGNDTLETLNQINPGTTPTFNISAIVTSVHVESGDIIVLGGLAQDSLDSNNDRIPIIGDIPGIGRLFQRNITNREKKVLMVFIRPLILRSERDNLEVTGSKYNHMRFDQLDIARAQEEYHKTDRNTIAPAWHNSELPKPFCHLNKVAVMK